MGCAASSRTKAESPSKIPPNILGAHYHVQHVLGRGQFSVVRAGLQRVTGDQVAIKTIRKSQNNFDMDMIREEIECMKRMRHPGCIQLFETFKGQDAIHLVQERGEGGDLWERIQQYGPISENITLHVTRQLADAIAYLHSSGVCHRDLKPENIVMMSRRAKGDPAYWTAKITDYGFSKREVQGYFKCMQTVLGTPEFVAPEVLKKMLPERVAWVSGLDQPPRYSAKVDVWSLGVIVYTMIAGKVPFSFDDNLPTLIQSIMQGQLDFSGEIWTKASSECKEVVRMLMTVDPAQRPTAKVAAAIPCVAEATAPGRKSIKGREAKEGLNATDGSLSKAGTEAEGSVQTNNYLADLDRSDLICGSPVLEADDPRTVDPVQSFSDDPAVVAALGLGRQVSETPSMNSLKNAEMRSISDL